MARPATERVHRRGERRPQVRYTAYSSSYRARAAGSGSIRRSTAVIAATPASRSARSPDARGREDRGAERPPTPRPRDRDRHAEDVRLDPRPGVAVASGGRPAGARGSGRRPRPAARRRERIANAAPSRTARASSARPCAERQADERAACLLVEHRRPLAREVGQEHEPARAGRHGGGRREQRPRRRPRRGARPRAASRPTRRVAAIAPPTTQRPGSGAGATNRPGSLDRAVGVDADPARRAARVHGVARRAEPRAEHRSPSRR